MCVNLAEVRSLIKLAHPNIVTLIEIIKEGETVYFVFEYLEMNIYDYMKSRDKYLNELQIRNIIYQTLQGLAYMHKHNYFHRDMKPENLLYFHDTVKIADFGSFYLLDSQRNLHARHRIQNMYPLGGTEPQKCC